MGLSLGETVVGKMMYLELELLREQLRWFGSGRVWRSNVRSYDRQLSKLKVGYYRRLTVAIASRKTTSSSIQVKLTVLERSEERGKSRSMSLREVACDKRDTLSLPRLSTSLLPALDPRRPPRYRFSFRTLSFSRIPFNTFWTRERVLHGTHRARPKP